MCLHIYVSLEVFGGGSFSSVCLVCLILGCLFLFYPILFYYFLDANFYPTEGKKDVSFGGWESGEDLGGGETIIRIY